MTRLATAAISKEPSIPNLAEDNDRKRARSGRVEAAIRARLAQSRKALVPYFTAGFPDEETFVALLHEAAGIGCDAIEAGIPFSDPIADGPTIQFSSQQALERGINIGVALEMIQTASIPAPVILMGYLNPIIAYGVRGFVEDAQAIGVAGVIVPDCPSENAVVRRNSANARRAASGSIDLSPLSNRWERILMAAPTTTPHRLAAMGGATRGFLYAVTVTGITGARSNLPADTTAFLKRARKFTARPVLAGFGIAGADAAKRISRHCDGVIVGSAIIDEIRRGPRKGAVRRVSRFLKRIRESL